MNGPIACDSGTEDQSVESVFTQRSPQFSECEEGNESTKNDNTPADQIVDADFAQNTTRRSIVNKPFDEFLDKVKGEDKQAIHECLVDSRLIEWSVFKLPAEVRHFSDENDFADYKALMSANA